MFIYSRNEISQKKSKSKSKNNNKHSLIMKDRLLGEEKWKLERFTMCPFFIISLLGPEYFRSDPASVLYHHGLCRMMMVNRSARIMKRIYASMGLPMEPKMIYDRNHFQSSHKICMRCDVTLLKQIQTNFSFRQCRPMIT